MHPSPLRSISNQQTQPYQDLAREATAMRLDLNQKDYELYEHERQQRQHENSSFFTPIQTLEGDKVQWIKKMNALLVEKDRLMQEKTDLAAQLHETRLKYEDLERKLQLIGRKQTSEKVFSADLKAEREENARLRDINRALETERADLRAKLRDFEMMSGGQNREKAELVGKLQQKQDHVSLLESDNRALQEQIRMMKVQVSDFDLERASQAHDRGALREVISRLEADKAEALVRISELSARHENYVLAISNEKTSIEWMHRRAMRTQCTPTLVLTLKTTLYRRLHRRFEDLKALCLHSKRTLRGTYDLIKTTVNLEKYSKKSALDHWRSCLDWPKTESLRVHAVGQYWLHTRTSYFFHSWKRSVYHQIHTKSNRKLGLTQLFSVMFTRRLGMMRGKWRVWKGLVTAERSRKQVFQSLIYRGSVGKVRDSLRLWRGSVRNVKTEQAKEDVSTVLSSTLLLQSILSGWKTVTARTRARELLLRAQQRNSERLRQTTALHELKRHLDSRKNQQTALSRVVQKLNFTCQNRAFLTLKEVLHEHKFRENVGKVLQRQNEKREEINMEKLFFAWKSSILTSKVMNLQGRLGEEIPKRLNLESEFRENQQNSRKSALISAIRLTTKRFTTQLRPFLHHWNSICLKMKQTHPLFRRFAVTWYWKKQENAFKIWKNLMLNSDLATLYAKNRELATETAALTELVGNLEKVLGHKEEEKTGITQKRLANSLKLAVKFQQRDAIRKWGELTLVTAAKTHSGRKIEKIIGKNLVFTGFKAILRFSNAKNKRNVRKNRLEFLEMKGNRTILVKFFEVWKEFKEINETQKAVFKHCLGKMSRQFEYLGMQKWKNQVLNRKHGETNQILHDLKGKNKNLGQELEETIGKLTAEMEINAKRTGKVRKNAQKRIGNAIFRLMMNNLYSSWVSLKSFTVLNRKQGTKIRQLGLIFNKQVLRSALKVWIFAASKSHKAEMMEQIVVTGRELKEARRQLKATQEDMKTAVETREAELEQNRAVLQVLEERLEGLLERRVKEQQNEYSLSKAGYVFKYWSNRYRLLKSSLHRLSHVITKSSVRDSFFSLRLTAQNNRLYASFTLTIRRWTDSFSHRHLRNGLSLWRHQTKALVRTELQTKLTEKTALAGLLQTLLTSQKTKTAAFGFEKHRKETIFKTFRGWKSTIDALRRIRIANSSFLENMRVFKLKFGLNNLKFHKETHKTRLKKIISARFRTEISLKRRLFSEFHKNAVSFRRFNAIFSFLNKRFTRESELFAFQSIQRVSHLTRLKATHFNATRKSVLGHLLRKLCYSRLNLGLKSWRWNGGRKGKGQVVLRRAVLRALHRKYGSAWGLWREHRELGRLEKYFVGESPIAVENQMLRHRVEIYSKLVQDEGIDSTYVEKYILDRESLAEALKRKGISRLMYAAGMTEKAVSDPSSILPRALLTWKVYVSKRKKVKRLANRMRAYRSNPTMSAFRTWKQGLSLVRNTLATYTRDRLLSLIAKMDRDIKTMEGMVDDQSKKLAFLKVYSSLLEQHTRRGRNQSLLVLRQHVQSPLSQALTRWNSTVTTLKLTEAHQQIVDVEDAYEVLRLKYEQLEQEYSLLFDENSELRQATMDGLDLADAIETLSKERERLSVDLAERAATIKQLLEENNELAARMRAAQKEAEALRVLTAPEREGRFA